MPREMMWGKADVDGDGKLFPLDVRQTNFNQGLVLVDVEAVDGVCHCGKSNSCGITGQWSSSSQQDFLCYWFESEEDNNGPKCGRAGVDVC